MRYSKVYVWNNLVIELPKANPFSNRKRKTPIRARPTWHRDGKPWRQAVAVKSENAGQPLFAIVMRMFVHHQAGERHTLALVRWLLFDRIEASSGLWVTHAPDSPHTVDVINTSTIIRPVGITPIWCLNTEGGRQNYYVNKFISRDTSFYFRDIEKIREASESNAKKKRKR